MPDRRTPRERKPLDRRIIGCNLGAVDVSRKPTYIYRMHWATGILASLGRVTAPRTGLPSNRFITSPVNPLGKSSCWDNVQIPTGCWPSGVEGTCFETGNIDQREPARDARGHPGGRPPC